MGIFSIFKKRSAPSQAPDTAAQERPVESAYLDDITFIQDMKHIPAGPWHQYDILFAAQIYGWAHMIRWAEYMSGADLKHISEVIVGEMYAGKDDITGPFHQNGDKLSELPEVSAERGMLSLAGMSDALSAPAKIVWINQTRVLSGSRGRKRYFSPRP